MANTNKSERLLFSDLAPEKTCNSKGYLRWAGFYSLLHLGVCSLFLLQNPEVNSRMYDFYIRIIMWGPFLYLYDLYFRQVWRPFRHELRRRGTPVPNRRWRRHPFDWEEKVFFAIPFFVGLLALSTLIGFYSGEWVSSASDRYVAFFARVWSIVGVPCTLFGLYHTFFIWKGRKHG